METPKMKSGGNIDLRITPASSFTSSSSSSSSGELPFENLWDRDRDDKRSREKNTRRMASLCMLPLSLLSQVWGVNSFFSGFSDINRPDCQIWWVSWPLSRYYLDLANRWLSSGLNWVRFKLDYFLVNII